MKFEDLTPNRASEPDRTLWELWRQGQKPDVRHYLDQSGTHSQEQVLAVLLVDQRERWTAGEKVLVETYVQDFSFLQTDPEALTDLAYAEFLVREHLGETPEFSEYQQRFPKIAETLRQQIALNQALQPSTFSEKNSSPSETCDAETMLYGPGRNGEVDQPHEVPAALREHPRYRVMRLLGTGGMGAVYLAEHRLMHRQVALKLINAEYLANPHMIERFQREIDAAARLQHPNIVSAFDAEEVQGVHFLAMEYVEGESLHEYLLRQQTLPVREACAYAQQVAYGLQHACDKGMVHRDIKPHNLMRTSEGTIKILDFGLVALAAQGQGAGLSSTGVVMGTPDYMAPEQTRDSHDVDIRADIYALGCTLYRMLSGQVPFPGRSGIDKLIAHRLEEVSPLRQVRADVPVEVEQIVQRMMAKSPQDRFQSPREVADALSVCLAEEDCKGPPPNKIRVALRLVAVAALVLLAGVVITIRQNGKETKLDVPPGSEVRVDKEGNIQIAVPNEIKDTPGFSEVRRFGNVEQGIMRMAVSPDGSHVLTAGGDGFARYWEVATGNLVHRLPSLQGQVYNVTISADGQKLLSCGEDRLIHVWDRATGKEIKRLEGHQATVSGVSISTDGKWMASGSNHDGSVRLWDQENGKEIHSFALGNHGSLGVAFSPDGKWLASWGGDATVRLIDVQKRKEIYCLRGHRAMVRAGMFSADGKRFLSGSHVLGGLGNLCLWDVEAGKLLRSIDDIPSGSHGVAITADGLRALSGGPNGGVFLWDLESGEKIAAFGLDRKDWTNDVTFLPDGRHALSATGGTIQLWKLPDPLKVGEVRRFLGHTGSVRAVAYSPCGRYALSGSGWPHSDGTIRLWELATGKEMWNRSIPMEMICCVAFSPDGRLAASGHHGPVRLWRVEAGDKLLVLNHGPRPVLSLVPRQV